ncbi:MAG: hypothetical protein GY906_15565 [bacterium]|nr:hypothetical protein [bacterium]
MTTFRGIGDPSVDGVRVASQDDLDQAVAQAEQAVADAQAAASSSEASATDAQAVLDEFGTLYLGTKSVDPTLDNNSNPLLTGALYYNDVELVVKVYNGTIWNSIGVLGPGTVVDENIVVFDGTTGNQIKDSGAKVTDFGDANGPGSAVDGNLAAFDGISGKLLQDAGILAAQVVINPGTSTAGHMAVFTDAGGKIVQDGGPVQAGGDVTGPGSSTDGNLAVFDGTTGKIIKDGGAVPGGGGGGGIGKNFIINPDFNLAQRGDLLGTAASTYQHDRWEWYQAAGMDLVVDLVHPVFPTLPGSEFTQFIAVATAESALAAGEYAAIGQHIEGKNIVEMLLGTASAADLALSFWVYSPKTGTHAVAFQNGALNRSYIATYTVSSANTWEYKTILLTGDVAGSWAVDNTIGLSVSWVLAAGSTYHTTAGAWQAGNFLGVTGMVNLIDTQFDEFYLGRVKLEIGSAVTDWSYANDVAVDTTRAKRYYDSSQQDGSAIPSATLFGSETAYASASGNGVITPHFRTTMRNAPTIRTWSPVTGTLGQVRQGAADVVPTIGQVTDESFRIATTGTASALIEAHWDADAELKTSN